MTENLGKASLDLEANLEPFEKNMQAGKRTAGDMQNALDAIAKVAIVAEIELNKVKMEAAQGAKSREIADTIERSVGRVGVAAIAAADHLDKVKLGAAQAEETTAAGDVIDRKLKDITKNANEARRATESVKIAGFGAGGNPGVGVGPFGSGFGRIGVLGAAIGAGTLLGPAAGPAALGALATIPTLAAGGAGALGVLALAFQGVTKAIGGNKKAFDDLGPSAQQFVLTVRSLDGFFDKLKQTAGASVFPGLTAGLKAALSPGTIGAITTAIEEFGNAIGVAGQTWGRYFGSAEFQSIFVPLMRAGAHELTLLSTAALALFDAFGVLGRAAIPFTTWLTTAIANGSKLADVWMHGKDASGGLSRAMDEAQVSLRLVGALLLAVGNAVAALGVALYPVAKIAVKDLTDGFNALAGIIHRNQDVIREIISTALSALVGAVKLAAGAIRLFIDGLSHIVGNKATIVTAILAIGIAIAVAMGPWSVAITGAILAVGMIERHWQELSDWMVAKLKWLAEKIGSVFSLIPSWIDPTLHNVGVQLQNWAQSTGTNMGAGMAANFTKAFQGSLNLKSLTAAGFNTDLMTGSSLRQIGDITYTGKDLVGVKTSLLDSLSQAVKDIGGNKVASIQITSAKRPPGPGNDVQNSNHITGDAVDGFVVLKNGKKIPIGTYIKAVAGAYGLRSGDVAGFDPKTPGGYDPVHVDDGANVGGAGGGGSTTDPFGTPPPWSSGLGPKPPKPPKPPVIPAAVTAALNAASTNAASASALNNTGRTAQRYLENELADLLVADRLLDAKIATAHGKAKTQLETALTGVENKLIKVQKQIADAIVITGDALLPDKLRAKLDASRGKFAADAAYAAVLTGDVAASYQDVIRKDLTVQSVVLTSEKDALKAKLAITHGKQHQAVIDEITKITTSLQSVQEQVLQNLQGVVQTLQGRVGTSFQSVMSQLDTAFQAKTQELVDALGVKFFQNGLLTPAEQALADANRQHTQDQLKQALLDAQQAYNDALTGSLVWDASTGLTTSNVNYPALKAAQKQLDAANEAIAQDKLQIAATAERTTADQQYAESVKLLQTTRAQDETAMNKALTDLAGAFQNGTGSMKELSRIADQYGIQITNDTIPDFDNLASSSKALIGALQDLANYIAKITGIAPKVPAGTTVTAGGWKGQVDGNGVPLSAGFGGFDANGNWVGGDINSIQIPKLDTGGTVMKTGMAVVHRGEDYLGVGANRRGQAVQLTVNGFVGNEPELAMQIGKLLQRANKSGVTFGIT